MIALLLPILLPLLVPSVRAQTKYASIPSPSMPIFVKTPYLNAWLPYPNSSAPGTESPIYWFGWPLGTTGLIRVDGKTFRWMGASESNDDIITPAETITQLISPTKTVLVMQAGAVQMNITWLSPIEPDDWEKQSFPFAYYYIDTATSDGKEHDIQLYTDITGEWVANDTSTVITWNTSETETIVYHKFQLQNQQLMKEIGNIAGDITIYLAAVKEFDVSWQVGANHSFPLDSFAANGSLDNSENVDFRAINAGFPSFSFSYNLSLVSSTQKSTAWAIGAVRDPLVSYGLSTRVQPRSSAYWGGTSSISNSMSIFMNDFPNAIARSDALDSKVMADGLAISSDYADLLALCLRQAMAGFEITISKDSNGNWNKTDVKTFMKDTGTAPYRVDGVDRIYAAFPVLLYLNASLVGTVLGPILESQATLGLQLSEAIGDFGQSYPVVSVSSTPDPAQTITYNGDMLFMLAAHAKKSGDKTLITNYYDMLKRWADTLVRISLHPGSTYTTANEILNYPDMSNLALQGILGIHAMSSIAEILGKEDDRQKYSGNASSQLSSWQELAFNGDHLITAYERPSSWSVMYNLYGARMIGLNVNQSILDAQSKFYEHQAVNAPQFGFPFVSEGSLVRSYWSLLTSATTTSNASRDILISQIHRRFFWSGTVDFPFPNTYDQNSGFGNNFPGGRAGPTLGSSFALLALNIPDKITTSSTNATNTNITTSGVPVPTSTQNDSIKGKNRTGLIVGATLGSLLGFIALTTGAFLLYRWLNPRLKNITTDDEIMAAPVTPFVSTIGSRQEGWPASETSKRRNVASGNILFNPMYPQTAIGSSPVTTTSENLSSSYNPISSDGHMHTSSSSPVLRNELDRIRREFDALRAQTPGSSPPTYYAGSETGRRHG